MSRQYLLLPHIVVHNANAMSSAYTVGFPAMTAWLGAFHKLERSLRQEGWADIRLTGLAVACEACRLQQYKKNAFEPASLVGTANPLKKNKKTGTYERPPFIAEARCDLTVSFILRMEGVEIEREKELESAIKDLLVRQKLAGGDVQNHPGNIRSVMGNPEGGQEERAFMRRLMPGFVLVERKDLLEKQEGDDIEKLLHAVVVHAEPVWDEKTGKLQKWEYHRDIPQGWIIPLAVGFRDLSGAVQAENQRDTKTEHHFVEPLVTLGEFKLPYRFERIGEILWSYRYDEAKGLYECVNSYQEER